MSDKTVDSRELDKFISMADAWWDPHGAFKPLHRFNPVRLTYIREMINKHYGKENDVIQPLKGYSLLDVGCGGGLLSEPLARMGALVTGIDAAEKNIKVAQIHAEKTGTDISYRQATVEALAEEGKQFDIVLTMEVVEHVDHRSLFLEKCASCVKPGGLLVVATLNRTAKSWLLAIVGAEYILRWLPRGTHEWHKFVTPDEIMAEVLPHDMEHMKTDGMTYNPLTGAWSVTRDVSVNYVLVFEKKTLRE